MNILCNYGTNRTIVKVKIDNSRLQFCNFMDYLRDFWIQLLGKKRCLLFGKAITETSPCAIGDFHKWLLYKCFMSLSLIVMQINIKCLKITVTWNNIWEKFYINYSKNFLKSTITYIIDYFYITPIKPPFYYISGI